ncbi:MAG TPA: acyltransferase [Longimicrobiales bacterium]|nr:acyltransferase [Longimicrobiales bacterium]
MKLGVFARRFLVPAHLRTLIYFLRNRALVSPRAEVDFTPNLVLGKGVVISAFSKIKATDGPLICGDGVMIGPGCFISSGSRGIRIGANTLIAANTVIVGNNHSYDRLDMPIKEQPLRSLGIEIGPDVWIGANVCILDGAKIGEGVVVSAGSVVSGTIPPRMIVAGNPAKPVFERR